MTIFRMHGYVRAPATAGELTYRCKLVREAAFRDTADRLCVVYIGSAGYVDLLAALSPGDVVYAYMSPSIDREQYTTLKLRGAKVLIVGDRRRPASYVQVPSGVRAK